MLDLYITQEEFYAIHDVEYWVPRNRCENALRAATNSVRADLRARSIDSSKIMVPVWVTGQAYAQRTSTSDYTGTATEAGNASRLVVEVFTDDAVTSEFYLEGSVDGLNWKRLKTVVDGQPMNIPATGTGVYTARFFEKFKYYRLRLSINQDTEVSYYAYLVDSSPDDCIMWKVLENAYAIAQDADTRTQELYDTARSEYSEHLNKLKTDYDENGDNSIDSDEINMRQQFILHR